MNFIEAQGNFSAGEVDEQDGDAVLRVRGDNSACSVGSDRDAGENITFKRKLLHHLATADSVAFRVGVAFHAAYPHRLPLPNHAEPMSEPGLIDRLAIGWLTG